MIAGVDISSRAVDIVLLDDDTEQATWHHYALAGATPYERARDSCNVLPSRSWWEDNGVWLVGLEDPRGPHAHTMKALGAAVGAFLALLPRDLTVIPTIAQEWKRLTVGAPGAGKDSVARWARAQLGQTDHETWNQDGYDAYAIARAVRVLNNSALTLLESTSL